jgi:hypothetical protein
VGAYVVTLLATMAASGGGVRPLYEGFSPPAPYRWVKPPPPFASGNEPPKPSITDVGLQGGTSGQAGISTDDAQVVLNLGPGTIPPHASDTKVTVTITPLDPATLSPPPGPLRADGNAYRVEAVYEPSRQPVDRFAFPGDILLTVPEPGHNMLFSPDGRSWQGLETQPVATSSVVAARLSQAGYFLGATSNPASTTTTARPGGSGSGGSTTGRAVIAALVVAGVAVALFAVPAVLRSRRGQPAEAGPTRGSKAGPRAGPKAGPKGKKGGRR